MSATLSLAFTWVVDKILYPILSWALPKAADSLMSKCFNKHIFIDDVITSVSNKTITFDIRVSNGSDQTIALTHLYCKLFNPPIKGAFYSSAVQDSSATYEVFDKDGKLITNVGNEEYYDFSNIVSKGNFIFQSKLLQKIPSKDTDRFKFVIHLAALTINPDLKNIETMITYAFHGKAKEVKIVKTI